METVSRWSFLARILRPSFLVHSSTQLFVPTTTWGTDTVVHSSSLFQRDCWPPPSRYISQVVVPTAPWSSQVKREEGVVKKPGSPTIPLLQQRLFHAGGGESKWTNNAAAERLSVTFIMKNGEKKTVTAPIGLSLLEVAHHYEFDLEGACEASLACSTCHVYVDSSSYDKLPPATESEDDMLDMAPALDATSRLGCQVILTKDLDGIEITIPPMTKNFYVDSYTSFKSSS